MGSGLSLLSPLGFPVSFRPGFGVLPLSLDGGVGHKEAQVRTGFTHSLMWVPGPQGRGFPCSQEGYIQVGKIDPNQIKETIAGTNKHGHRVPARGSAPSSGDAERGWGPGGRGVWGPGLEVATCLRLTF